MPSQAEASQVLLDRFTRFLRERRLPLTAQRRQVAEALFTRSDHPSVDQLRKDLASRGAPVGTATVYRVLALLVESGVAVEHDFGEGFRRYERATGPRHEHLVCSRCGRVDEFTNERLERMLEMIADEHEFLHRRHRVELYGLCVDCRGRDAAALRATLDRR